MISPNHVKIVSLFANIGIAETYIEAHVANEINKKRADCYSVIHPKTTMIQGDITDDAIYQRTLKEAIDQKCNFILATPPCQGMSNLGHKDKKDKRNRLIKYVVSFIKDSNIPYALIENVPPSLKYPIEYQGETMTIRDYLSSALWEDYNIDSKIINTADFGVPQIRKRAIIGISKKGYKPFHLFDLEKVKEHVTLEEAIGHLPSLESEETSDIPYHNAKRQFDRHILCLKHTPTGKSAKDNPVYYPKNDGKRISGYPSTYRRVHWDRPAYTITMGNGSVGSQNCVHPGRLKEDGTYSDARVFTLKELFIITGLPDDYSVPFWVSENFVREAIGEGLPPLVLHKIVNDHLLAEEKE